MTACIVGWSHTPFGRHEAEDVESLIVKVAKDAVADAGLGPGDRAGRGVVDPGRVRRAGDVEPEGRAAVGSGAGPGQR